MTTIETPRLLLRPWQSDDLAELSRLLADPEVTRYIILNEAFTPHDLAAVSARTLQQWHDNGFGPWVAIEKATGRWVGRIGLNEILDWPYPDRFEIGWELHQEFWGRGLATEGGQAAMRYGFEVVGLGRIMSATMATNAASRRVMDKCGLLFQGELHLPDTRTGLVLHRPGAVAGRPDGSQTVGSSPHVETWGFSVISAIDHWPSWNHHTALSVWAAPPARSSTSRSAVSTTTG